MGQICLGSVKETEYRDEPDAIDLKLYANPHNSPTPHFCDDPLPLALPELVICVVIW
jgi:hypothetical protein